MVKKKNIQTVENGIRNKKKLVEEKLVIKYYNLYTVLCLQSKYLLTKYGFPLKLC